MLFSFIAATSSTFTASSPGVLGLGVHIASAAGMLGVRQYVWDFWHDKSRVPFVQGYNDGMRFTERIEEVLLGLTGAWGVASVLGLVVWLSG